MGVHVATHGDLDEQESVGGAPNVLGRVMVEQEPVVVGFEGPGRDRDFFASHVFQAEFNGAQVGPRASVMLAGRHQHVGAGLRIPFR